MQFEQLTQISGISILHVANVHDAGQGTLTAATSDTLTWQAPNSETAGDEVTIANGETKIIADGDDASDFIVVTRTSASDLDGTCVLLLLTTKSTQERLEEVDEAISNCLKAQASGQGDSNITRASLDSLRRYRKELYAELLREQDSSARVAQADMSGNF